MRLTKEIRKDLRNRLLCKTFNSRDVEKTGQELVTYIESLVPFQKAVKALEDYPEFTSRQNTTLISADYSFPHICSSREFILHTGMAYAGRRESGSGYLGLFAGIAISLFGDSTAEVRNLSDQTIRISEGDPLYDTGAPLFSWIRERVAFEKTIEIVLNSTSSLSKAIALLPPLQKMFPEEKPARVTEAEKDLLMPEGLGFAIRRLEKADL